MIEVRLCDSTNNPIDTVFIPHTRILPSLLVWGNRYFERDHADEGKGEKPSYLEIDDVLRVPMKPNTPIKQKAEVDDAIEKLEKKNKELET
jgi:hypothetical protein